LPACAGGGGIEAPPAHGFKRSLASVDSALARILCADGGIARPLAASIYDYILNKYIDYVPWLCYQIRSLAH
jgi:hypothetical protein